MRESLHGQEPMAVTTFDAHPNVHAFRSFAFVVSVFPFVKVSMAAGFIYLLSLENDAFAQCTV